MNAFSRLHGELLVFHHNVCLFRTTLQLEKRSFRRWRKASCNPCYFVLMLPSNNLVATVEIVMENTNSGVIKLALTEEQFQGCCKTELKITNGGDSCALWYGD